MLVSQASILWQPMPIRGREKEQRWKISYFDGFVVCVYNTTTTTMFVVECVREWKEINNTC